MKSIILISHGDMAQGAKSSLEMIIGRQESVHVVSLGKEEDNIQFEKSLLEKVDAVEKPVTIIADLLGGTPCNVAVKNYMDVPEVSVFAGMSLSLLIECATNFSASNRELINNARQGVTDVKEQLNHTENEIDSSEIKISKDYSKYQGKANIVNVRIDERLIHGQVAGIWTTSLDTQRIVVANDEAASNSLQKSSLRLAAPSSMRLSILPVEKAAQNIQSGKYGNQRVFLLFKNPADVLKYIELGGVLTTVNVGNMSFKEGSKEITKNIRVMPDEEVIFKNIADKGIKITAQLVPNDPIVDFISKLKEK